MLTQEEFYLFAKKVTFLLRGRNRSSMFLHEVRSRMDIEYKDEDLDRLETELAFTAGFSRDVVKGFRKRIQVIRAAHDERDFYQLKGNRFEKLKGNRAHQYSMRVNDQWRLIVEIKPASPKNIISVIGIEDYH